MFIKRFLEWNGGGRPCLCLWMGSTLKLCWLLLLAVGIKLYQFWQESVSQKHLPNNKYIVAINYTRSQRQLIWRQGVTDFTYQWLWLRLRGISHSCNPYSGGDFRHPVRLTLLSDSQLLISSCHWSCYSKIGIWSQIIISYIPNLWVNREKKDRNQLWDEVEDKTKTTTCVSFSSLYSPECLQFICKSPIQTRRSEKYKHCDNQLAFIERDSESVVEVSWETDKGERYPSEFQISLKLNGIGTGLYRVLLLKFFQSFFFTPLFTRPFYHFFKNLLHYY